MSKLSASLRSKANIYCQRHPTQLEIVDDTLMCKLCIVPINVDLSHIKDRILGHFQTKKHQNQLKKVNEKLLSHSYLKHWNRQMRKPTRIGSSNASQNGLLNQKYH